MNAYEMDSYPTYYAANTPEEATKLYLNDTGPDNVMEEDCPRLLSDDELDEKIQERDEDEALTGRTTTMRAWLNAMTEPGFLASAL